MGETGLGNDTGFSQALAQQTVTCGSSRRHGVHKTSGVPGLLQDYVGTTIQEYLKYSLASFQNLLNNRTIETIQHPTMTTTTLTPLTEDQAVRALAALAQATRLRLFRELVVAGQAGLSAGALSSSLGIAPSALSFHLKELSHANLIEARQDGRFMFYSARFDAMNALLGFLTENCCQGEQCAPQTECGC